MADLKRSSIWPEWELVELLGRGAYGEVYKAVRTDSGVTSLAAIKIIDIPSDPDELDSLRAEGLGQDATDTYLREIVSDFVNEIQIMETFKGVQNIVSVEDYKVVKKPVGYTIYIRMELLTPFNSYLDNRQMPEREIVQLGVDLCNALDICARRNVIHRDVKPENIFINEFGSFKLGDFGVARSLENHSSRLSTKGTYNYMAPEVAQNRVYDTRADLYSLGIVLYRLANGNRFPFLSERQLLSPRERQNALEQRLNGALLPAPVNASPALSRVILKACSFRPEDRYANASEMRRELTAILRGDTDSTVSVIHQPAGGRADGNGYAARNAVGGGYVPPVGGGAYVPRGGSVPQRQVYTAPVKPEKNRGPIVGLLIAGIAVLSLLILGLVLRAAGIWPTKDAASPSSGTEIIVARTPEPTLEPTPTPQPTAGPTPEPTPTPAPTPAPTPTPDPNAALIESTRQQVTAYMTQGDYDAALAQIDSARVQLGDPTALEDLRQQVLAAQYDDLCTTAHAFDPGIVMPAQSSMLPAAQRETRYVQGIYGQGIWLTRDGDSRISLMEEGTELTIYALENGRAFVRVVDGRWGWAKLERLAVQFDAQLSHQRKVDYVIDHSEYWTADGWREFIIANAGDFPDYIVQIAILG